MEIVPVCFHGLLQVRLFPFGFRFLDESEDPDHLAVGIEPECAAPAQQSMHVVLHVRGGADSYAAAKAFAVMLLLSSH
jgi:hypothetical protein